MPNTREKLIKIIADNPNCFDLGYKSCDECVYGSCEDCYTEALIDCLIANGVTVQEWISVKERLPEQTDPATFVLGITQKSSCHIVCYYKGVTDDRFTGFYDNAMKVAVTHWMPLPEPPKGE